MTVSFDALKESPELRDEFITKMKEQELTDEEIELLIRLGDLLMADNQQEAAEPLYAMALEKDPNKVRAAEQLIDIYIKHAPDADKAAGLAPKYAATQPPPDSVRLAHTYKEIGRLYLNEEDDAVKAAEFYAKAIALRPDHWKYQYGLGLALRYQDRFTEAFDVMKKALELVPEGKDKGEVLYMLGELSGLLYNPHQARAYYEQALKYDNKMVYAYHNLVATCYALSDFREGNDYLQKAFALYEEELKNGVFEKDPGKYYYYAELMRDYKGPKETADYELWEKMLTKYNESQYAAVDGMAEMFKMQLARRRAIEDGEYLARHAERDHYFEQYHGKMISWYNKATERFKSLFKETTDKVKLKDFHAQIAKLYLG
ncbi:MAG TPA: tetratricopeptide repeat protein, partial [Chitinophagaceae bacterium]|nr:tetratricopeptide repeat protein [Chitinophagaceae bacterium]